ncbi:glutaredoxin family protein [Pseudomonas sp. F1_0610]|uniref:glutaredoxin family protein n=1 Tax=Pseudomonas sp. F1_0610 TaxID=3114284 RepID=UPI0039C00C5F
MMFFQLMGTQGCHLCEVAEQILAQLITASIRVELIDIAEETQYFDAYSLRIPVLKNSQTGAELNWPFTLEQAKNFISST